MTADTPVAGFYKVRLARGAVWSPLRIWFGPPHDPLTGEELDRSPRWQALCRGEEIDVWRVWPYAGRFPIDAATYAYMMDLAEWAKSAPDAPEHKPRERVDLNRLPGIF